MMMKTHKLNCLNNNTIVIVGGGAAGMLAAISAGQSNNLDYENKHNSSQVILLEKNEKLGKKLFISGKGRCNITNNCDKDTFFKNIVHNNKFIYSAFSKFNNFDLQKLVVNHGCELKIERGNRVFPISDKSYDVINALKKAVKESGAKVKLNTEVIKINKIGNKFEIFTNRDECIIANKIIIATGGLSYPSTGSTGDGYEFAKKFKINVIKQSPSLVPLNIKETNECKKMQGLTLKNVSIKIFNCETNKVIYKDFGEMLFTHFGTSGPLILSASCFIDDNEIKKYILSIDLKPALTKEQLNLRLIREIDKYKLKTIKSTINSLLPLSFTEIFLNRLYLNCKKNYKNEYINFTDFINIKNSEITKNIRTEIINLLKDYSFHLVSKRGFDEAIITSGGIDVKEINPKTMESKNVKGLYFAGEVIDVDALTGGFNIQIAASTGFLAGLSCKNQ